MVMELKGEAAQLERSLSWVITKKIVKGMEAKEIAQPVRVESTGSLAVLGRYRQP